MDKSSFDNIEAYLLGKMSSEESAKFKSQILNDPEIRCQVETLALDIYAIQQLGLKEDQTKIDLLRKNVNLATKRLWISSATVAACAILAAAAIFTPVYEFVVVPIVENYKNKQKSETEAPTIPAPALPSVGDSISNEVEDTVLIENMSSSNAPSTNEVRLIEQSEAVAIEPEPSNAVATKDEEAIQEEEVENKRQIQQVTHIPKTNRIVSTDNLEDFDIGKVSARRIGNKILCSFTMKNTEEDAEIQMHSARAKDINDKIYDTKWCMLNGKSSRIIEKWKKGEEHNIEITIDNVDQNVSALSQISFSFQSKGKNKKQKSKSIKIEVGNIE